MMIFFETANQAHVFLLLLFAGMAAGGLYDFLSFFRRKCGSGLTVILDLIYFLCAGALCFFALALGGEKSLRLYTLLGILCGAGIYSLGIRRVIVWIIQIIGNKWNKKARRNGKDSG